MSELVERLAKRFYKEWVDNEEIIDIKRTHSNEARWWLNAIADELERDTANKVPSVWLRAQANED